MCIRDSVCTNRQTFSYVYKYFKRHRVLTPVIHFYFGDSCAENMLKCIKIIIFSLLFWKNRSFRSLERLLLVLHPFLLFSLQNLAERCPKILTMFILRLTSGFWATFIYVLYRLYLSQIYRKIILLQILKPYRLIIREMRSYFLNSKQFSNDHHKSNPVSLK